MSDLWNSEPGGGGISSVAWGDITGTLSAQTDLQSALDAKQDDITLGTTAQYFRGDLSLATFPTAVSAFTNDSGYLTSFTELDPVFTASQAFNIDATDITNLSNLSGVNTGDQDLSGYQLLSEKGNANGYASLDSGGKVPVAQLPSSIMEYKGVWNASTNTPTLIDGTGDNGDVYRVSVAGSQDLGSGSISFEVGDYVIYNSTTWEKSDTTDAVASVFGRTGIVTAQANDYTWAQINKATSNLADITTKSHTVLSDIGTNTHAQIDTHIATSAIHFTVGSIDHGSIAGLGDDDHTQYALLAGRSGGQTLIGGTASGNDLTLQSTSNATKGTIFFGASGNSGYSELDEALGVGTQVFTGPGGILDSGQVGILHLQKSTNANVFFGLYNGDTGTAAAAVFRVRADSANINFQAHAAARTVSRFGVTLGGYAEMIQTTGNGFVIGTTGATPLILGTGSVNALHIDTSQNIGIGTTTFGTSAAKVLGLANGTAPSTSPADMVQLFSTDISAGNASLGLRTETAVTAAAAGASDAYLNIKINGVTYKLLLHT